MSAPPRDSDSALVESVVQRYVSTGRFDEMLDAERTLRPAWHEVGALLDVLGPHGLRERGNTVRRLLEDDGVTYRAHGAREDQAWALDPVPLVIDEAQWAALESALVQRAELLDLILDDLYGPRKLIEQGLLPPEVVFGHSGFLREVDQIRLPGKRHQLFLAAEDLARDSSGQWLVLADRTQAPSGAGYAMENRRAISRAMTGLHRAAHIRRIGPFFQAMRHSLQQLASTDHEVPRVVLLTPGSGSETGFDQAYLSSLLGFPLVEGSDLTFRDGRIWQRSVTGRSEPVDVILRRVDSWFCDPLELRPDSRLGVPGLVEASRLGTVAIANPLGAGVLENPGLFPFLGAICHALLDQQLQLESVTTYWCGDPIARAHALANLDSLVFKPIARLIGRSSRFGARMSQAQREELARRIEADPWSWVAQEEMDLSCAPTVAGSELEARPVVLRSFAVSHGHTYRVMHGGLVRVAPSVDAEVVSNLSGAVSKDLWVLSPGPQLPDQVESPSPQALDAMSSPISPRVAEDFFWLGRYAERAEDTARLLRVTDDRWRDMHAATDPALARCLQVLLRSVTVITSTWPGFLGDGAAERIEMPRDELLSLLGDQDRLGTIAYDVRRLREIANAVRDQLSNDTWLVLGVLDRTLAPFEQSAGGGWRAADDITPALASVLSSLLALTGIIAENMVRDSGWHFLDLGRRLERAIGISSLLNATLSDAYPSDTETLVIESTLIAADSLITHRRRFSAASGAESVLRLLLVDPDNPRSVAYQLERIASHLGQLGADAEPIRNRVKAILVRLHESDLAAMATVIGTRREALVAVLEPLHLELTELCDEIATASFVPAGSMMVLNPFVMMGAT